MDFGYGSGVSGVFKFIENAEVMAVFFPIKRLINADFPTFGRPQITIFFITRLQSIQVQVNWQALKCVGALLLTRFNRVEAIIFFDLFHDISKTSNKGI